MWQHLFPGVQDGRGDDPFKIFGNKMKKITLIAALLLSTSAFATNSNDSTPASTTNNNQTYNQPGANATGNGGQGGTGGQGGGGGTGYGGSATGGTGYGGTGVGIGQGGTASATGGAGGSVSGSGNSSNLNKNTNTNTNQQAQGQQQGQAQGQSQSIKNSGNSSSTSGVKNSGNSASSSSSNSGGNTQSNAGNNASTSVSVGGDAYEAARVPVSTAYAPSIAPTAPCMGSSSGGIQGMSVGISVGSTWTDSNCQLLEQVRVVAVVIGDKDTAAEMMANVPAYAEAKKRIAARKASSQPTVLSSAVLVTGVRPMASSEAYTDPLIRSRLGLPPLSSK